MCPANSGLSYVGCCIVATFCSCLARLRWRKAKKIAQAAVITTAATPTPIPASAPVESPDEEEEGGTEVEVAVGPVVTVISCVPVAVEDVASEDAVVEDVAVEELEVEELPTMANSPLKTSSPKLVPLTRMNRKGP